jgi:hypothetical protein
MKTTFDVPDVLLTRAQLAAAMAGISLEQFLCEAIEQRLELLAEGHADPLAGLVGELRDLHAENRGIERRIEKEFERIDEDPSLRPER